MEKTQIILPPFFIEVDGVIVEVLEVVKRTSMTGYSWYSVAVRYRYKGIRSKIIHYDVKDTEDLKNKLKVEVAKIKFLEATFGINYVREVLL